MSDRTRQIIVTLSAVFMIVGTLFGTGVIGTRVEEASGGSLSATATLIAPLPAFSIWSVIYTRPHRVRRLAVSCRRTRRRRGCGARGCCSAVDGPQRGLAARHAGRLAVGQRRRDPRAGSDPGAWCGGSGRRSASPPSSGSWSTGRTGCTWAGSRSPPPQHHRDPRGLGREPRDRYRAVARGGRRRCGAAIGVVSLAPSAVASSRAGDGLGLS